MEQDHLAGSDGPAVLDEAVVEAEAAEGVAGSTSSVLAKSPHERWTPQTLQSRHLLVISTL